jgi:hypothetical protein
MSCGSAGQWNDIFQVPLCSTSQNFIPSDAKNHYVCTDRALFIRSSLLGWLNFKTGRDYRSSSETLNFTKENRSREHKRIIQLQPCWDTSTKLGVFSIRKMKV